MVFVGFRCSLVAVVIVVNKVGTQSKLELIVFVPLFLFYLRHFSGVALIVMKSVLHAQYLYYSNYTNVAGTETTTTVAGTETTTTATSTSTGTETTTAVAGTETPTTGTGTGTGTAF